MGNSNQKAVINGRINHRPEPKAPNNYSSQFSLSNFLPNLSGRSFVSGVSQQSTYSVSRPWSRVSRRRWHERTLNDPLVASKTAWPVPYIEAVFLPEFKIKGDVSEEDFELISLVSKGAFGTVYKVQKIDTGMEYALKVLSKSLLISQNAVEQVKDEVRIQSMCGHHPFIVNSPFFWQNRKRLFIVSEFISGGELLELCQVYGQLPEELVRVYVAEIALALDFLHNAGIIYRDLKLENLLLDRDNHIQLIDFGLAKWLKYGARTSTICGTIQYMAPEVMSMEPYGHAVDWWSLGIVMCCMLSGEFPTVLPSPASEAELAAGAAAAAAQTAAAVAGAGAPGAGGGGRRLRRPARLLIPSDGFGVGARALARRLLDLNPGARLRSARALQETAFFHGFNMEDARSKKFQPKEILHRHFPDGPPPAPPSPPPEPMDEDFEDAFADFSAPAAPICASSSFG